MARRARTQTPRHYRASNNIIQIYYIAFFDGPGDGGHRFLVCTHLIQSTLLAHEMYNRNVCPSCWQRLWNMSALSADDDVDDDGNNDDDDYDDNYAAYDASDSFVWLYLFPQCRHISQCYYYVVRTFRHPLSLTFSMGSNFVHVPSITSTPKCYRLHIFNNHPQFAILRHYLKRMDKKKTVVPSASYFWPHTTMLNKSRASETSGIFGMKLNMVDAYHMFLAYRTKLSIYCVWGKHL